MLRHDLDHDLAPPQPQPQPEPEVELHPVLSPPPALSAEQRRMAEVRGRAAQARVSLGRREEEQRLAEEVRGCPTQLGPSSRVRARPPAAPAPGGAAADAGLAAADGHPEARARRWQSSAGSQAAAPTATAAADDASGPDAALTAGALEAGDARCQAVASGQATTPADATGRGEPQAAGADPSALLARTASTQPARAARTPPARARCGLEETPEKISPPAARKGRRLQGSPGPPDKWGPASASGPALVAPATSASTPPREIMGGPRKPREASEKSLSHLLVGPVAVDERFALPNRAEALLALAADRAAHGAASSSGAPGPVSAAGGRAASTAVLASISSTWSELADREAWDDRGDCRSDSLRLSGSVCNSIDGGGIATWVSVARDRAVPEAFVPTGRASCCDKSRPGDDSDEDGGGGDPTVSFNEAGEAVGASTTSPRVASGEGAALEDAALHLPWRLDQMDVLLMQAEELLSAAAAAPPLAGRAPSPPASDAEPEAEDLGVRAVRSGGAAADLVDSTPPPDAPAGAPAWGLERWGAEDLASRLEAICNELDESVAAA